MIRLSPMFYVCTALGASVSKFRNPAGKPAFVSCNPSAPLALSSGPCLVTGSPSPSSPTAGRSTLFKWPSRCRAFRCANFSANKFACFRVSNCRFRLFFLFVSLDRRFPITFGAATDFCVILPCSPCTFKMSASFVQ